MDPVRLIALLSLFPFGVWWLAIWRSTPSPKAIAPQVFVRATAFDEMYAGLDEKFYDAPKPKRSHKKKVRAL